MNDVTHHRWSARFAVIIAAAGVSLAACQSLKPVKTESARLVAAVSALKAAETYLYDQMIEVSEARQRLAFERAFVLADHDASYAAKLYAATTPQGYDKARALRLKLIDELSAYAAEIDAIGGGDTTAWPTAEAKATADGATKLASSLFAGAVPAYVAPTLSVIDQLAAEITSGASATKVEQLASHAEPAIEALAAVLKSDDEIIDAGIPALISAQRIDAGAIFEQLYPEPGDALARLRLAREIPQMLPEPLAIAHTQQLVGDAMTKIVAANEALAKRKPRQAAELLDDAAALADQAGASTAKSKGAH